MRKLLRKTLDAHLARAETERQARRAMEFHNEMMRVQASFIRENQILQLEIWRDKRNYSRETH